jgi:hypothetical protein
MAVTLVDQRSKRVVDGSQQLAHFWPSFLIVVQPLACDRLSAAWQSATSSS